MNKHYMSLFLIKFHINKIYLLKVTFIMLNMYLYKLNPA